MDALTVTREEFRLEMNKLLEFLAQGLGGVPGTYSNEVIDPLALLLAGEPKLLSTAIPPAADDSQRLPSTSWVLDIALTLAGGTMLGDLLLKGPPTADLMAASKAYVDERSFAKYKAATSGNVATYSGGTVQFKVPGFANYLQIAWVRCGPTNASGQVTINWDVPFVAPPFVICSPLPPNWAAAGNQLAVHPVNPQGGSCGFQATVNTSPWSGGSLNAWALGSSVNIIP